MHATFIEDRIFYLDKEGTSLHIIDPSDTDNEIKWIELAIEELCSIHYIENKAIAIFSGEFFNLNIFDFREGSSTEDILNFNFSQIFQFEEVFSPSDNMLSETAKYHLHNITDTKFNFISCSYGDSINIIFKTEENNWALESVDEQSIRVLAPADRDGDICSFKGVSYYPMKFSEDEEDSCSYKFTEEDLVIASPRKVVTLAYTGRIDIHEIFFKDITEYQDKVKEQRKEIEITDWIEEVKGDKDSWELIGSKEEDKFFELDQEGEDQNNEESKQEKPSIFGTPKRSIFW